MGIGGGAIMPIGVGGTAVGTAGGGGGAAATAGGGPAGAAPFPPIISAAMAAKPSSAKSMPGVYLVTG